MIYFHLFHYIEIVSQFIRHTAYSSKYLSLSKISIVSKQLNILHKASQNTQHFNLESNHYKGPFNPNKYKIITKLNYVMYSLNQYYKSKCI